MLLSTVISILKLSKYLFANKRKELQLKRKISPQLHRNHHKKLTKKNEQYS